MKQESKTCKPTRRHLIIGGCIGAALLVFNGWVSGASGMAAGTWEVDPADIPNYVRDHWAGPAGSDIGVRMVGFLSDPSVSIELNRDGTYQVDWVITPKVMQQKIGGQFHARETGNWKLQGATMQGGSIEFRPGSHKLLQPDSVELQNTYQKLSSQAHNQTRTFEWTSVDANTLLWKPLGSTAGRSAIHIRRK